MPSLTLIPPSSSSPAPQERPRESGAPAGWLLAFAVGLQGMAALLRTPGLHEREERYNASHAAFIQGEWSREGLLDGSWLDLLVPLQYQPFCGGCTVDAVVGAASFHLLGPSILAWRVVGLAFFALATACGLFTAGRLAGRPATWATGVFFAMAPPAYQELALISNGNHPEGGAVLLLQVALGVAAITARSPRRREAALFALALLVGFGLYLLRSLILGMAVLGATGLVAGSWRARLLRLPLLGVGLALGASPVLAVRHHFGAWPVQPIYQADEWVLSLDNVPRDLASLLLPVQIRGIWGDVHLAPFDGLGLLAFSAWVLLVAAGSLAVWRGRTAEPKRHRALVPPVAALGGFLVLYPLYRLGIWMDGATPPFPQQLRYLGLIYPLLILTGGTAAGLLLRSRPPWRFPSLRGVLPPVLLGFLLLPGLVSRGTTLLPPYFQQESLLPPWPLPTATRRAPDRCFQLERVRGDRAVLERASPHAPLPLVPFSVGLLAGDPGFALRATPELPDLRTLGARTGEGRDTGSSEVEALYRGFLLGILLRARHPDPGSDPGSDPHSEKGEGDWARRVEETLAARRHLLSAPPPASLLWEAAWCHARNELFATGFQQGADLSGPGPPSSSGDTARELRALARGAAAARTCVRASPKLSRDPASHSASPVDLVLSWTPACAAWCEEPPLGALGFGMGASLAESHGGGLEHLHVAVAATAWEPETETRAMASLRRGFEQGWSFGRTLSWLPNRLPPVQVRWNTTSTPFATPATGG